MDSCLCSLTNSTVAISPWVLVYLDIKAILQNIVLYEKDSKMKYYFVTKKTNKNSVAKSRRYFPKVGCQLAIYRIFRFLNSFLFSLTV